MRRERCRTDCAGLDDYGQLLSIAQNTALFSLLGTTYGGDGQTTFALPDLRGRVPIHTGSGPGLPSRDLGSTGGAASSETVNLIGKQKTYAPGGTCRRWRARGDAPWRAVARPTTGCRRSSP